LIVLGFLAGACASGATPPSEAGGKYWKIEDPLGEAEALRPSEDDLEALEVTVHLYRVSIQRDGETYAALWRGARALCQVAIATPSRDVQASRASEAMGYAERARRLEPTGVEGRYFLAVSAGLVAETRSTGALGLVPTIESEAIEALRLDPGFEEAGAHRILGELYHQAPGFPVSVGDDDLALEHLREAVRIAPDFPPNRIALAEVYLSEGADEEARRTLAPLLESGPELPPRWPDRWEELKSRLTDP
jgi:tetratricopeptide (TPR) repeat protein